jgi:excisionase family DNA binding protein
MNMKNSPLLTTKEVATYLKINEKKVYQLIKEGKIPCSRIGGKWLFPKKLIDEWITKSVQTQKDLFIAGSNDIFLQELITSFINENFPESLVYYTSIGSAKGLKSLAMEKANIAAAHLFDPGTGEYNIPFLKKYLGSTGVVVINLVYREQGLLLQKGNPHEIKGLEDLARKKIKFINRNVGSGTRLLLDYELKQKHLSPEEINGYHIEVNTHLDVGLSILSGRVDAGIGIRYIAHWLGLEFVPISWERFDLIIKKDDFYLPSIQKFLSLLDPIKISLYSPKFPGYDFKDTGRIIFES